MPERYVQRRREIYVSGVHSSPVSIGVRIRQRSTGNVVSGEFEGSMTMFGGSLRFGVGHGRTHGAAAGKRDGPVEEPEP